MRFADKVVLVTGASRNTGLGIAARFAAEGATVFVNGTTAEGVGRAVAELRARGRERLIEAPADLGDTAAVEGLFALIREHRVGDDHDCQGADRRTRLGGHDHRRHL